jgi:glutamate N-acetyltransferase/amino-acid N-acetyltransferase
MEIIKGDITTPRGFLASAVSSGIKKEAGALDTALLFSERIPQVAGVFTTNQLKAASIRLSQQRLNAGIAQAIIVLSGNANCAVGEQGLKDALRITHHVAKRLKIKEEAILIACTGVIGQRLPVKKILSQIKPLVGNLTRKNGLKFAKAILTTDTKKKSIAVKFHLRGKEVTLGGVAKGAGMIHPKLATLLGFCTTDCRITQRALQKALKIALESSFNKISVDGDTSPNDCIFIMANGMAGNEEITLRKPDFKIFSEALSKVTKELAKMIVKDGEGATKFIKLNLTGARSQRDATLLGEAVVRSPLVKCAFYGASPNWGRILSALGASGGNLLLEKVDIYCNSFRVVKNGQILPKNEYVSEVLKRKEINITINLNLGKGKDTFWMCDLSPQYVRINAHYLT